MKYLLIIAAIYGALIFAAKNMDYDKMLAAAKKNPSASWAPKLEYSVGVFCYQRSDYPNAIKAFTQLLADYPTAQYAPKALFRLGDSGESIMNWEVARESYARYAEEYPDGEDINIVRKRLELVNYNHPKK